MSQVAILLCTYRGAPYLRAQLDSILQQSEQSFCICASDDGSDDGTRELLQSYAARLGPERMRLYDGPRRGFAANFFSLLMRNEIQASYYAFTDQDDEWEPSKLARAQAALSALPEAQPALYGSRSQLIDTEGQPLGYSRLFRKPPSFANALVQNMVSGNTMVLNHAAIQLLRRAGTQPHVSAHDWWAYQLIMGAGGAMVYDPFPTVRYRQHGHNLYGANTSLSAASVRVRKLFAGDFREWNARNVAALRACSHLLTPKSQAQLERFAAARTGGPVARLLGLVKANVYRQTVDGQLGLMVAALSNRI